jgi:hypothetical protein
VDKGCWADTTLDSGEDVECDTSCYSVCDSYLDSAFDLCTCAHGACVKGCDSNCHPDVLATCKTDCTVQASGASTPITSFCEQHCNDCVNVKKCWVDDGIFGGCEDEDCLDECYGTSCDTYLGASSKLCDCSHNYCIVSCP